MAFGVFFSVLFVVVAYAFAKLQLYGAGSNFAEPLYQASIVTYLATSTDADVEDLEIVYNGMGSVEGLCRLKDFVKTCAVSDTADPHDIDFSASDVILTESDYSQFEDLQMFPTAAGAVVPIYNLPSLAPNETLILTADVLARIYRRRIVLWSDVRITSINPTIQGKLKSMGNTTIALCGRGDSSGTSMFLTSYIATVTSVNTFVTKVGVSALPTWANGTHLVIKQAGMAAFVSQQAGSLGYIGLYDALRYKLSMASILKPDGSIVAPSTTGLAYAASELGMSFGNNGDDPSHLTADLHNAKASLAWPIAGYTYLVMRKNLSRAGATCYSRYETVKFWYWFYTSQTAVLLTSLYGFVPLSESARAIVSQRLEAGIYCNDRMVFKAVPPAPINLGITPFFLDNMRFMFEGAYLSISPESTFTYLMVNLSTPVDLTDVMIFKGLPFQMKTNAPPLEFISFPFAGIAYVFLCNICGPDSPYCLESSANSDTLTLSMTGEVIYKILSGQILYWNDSEIAALNSAFSIINHKITLVLSKPVLEDLKILNFAFPDLMSSFVFNSSRVNLRIVDTEMDSYLQVTEVPYTMTFLHFTSNIATITLLPLWQNPLLVSSIVRADGANVFPSMGSIQLCTTDTYKLNTNKFSLPTSKNSGCYPLSLSYRFVSRRHYDEQVCDANSRAVQNTAFLAWIFERGPRTTAFASFQMLPLFALNDVVYKKTKDELLSITCNGVSLLAIPSNYNYISSWATPLSWALAIIMMLLGAGFVFWLFLYRKHKVVKFAQPEFLCLIILGAVLITFSIIPLSLDDYNVEYYSLDAVLNLDTQSHRLNKACMVVPWLYVTGFALEFAALFAKVWRLKKIFLTKQLRRVRQTAKDMVPILIVCLMFGWCLCATWTGVAPLHWKRTATAFNSNGYMIDSYARCTSEAFAAFYAVLFVLELSSLFYGMVLCYQTRNVQEEFVENKWITIVLINMMSTLLLTVVLGFFMRQNPSALFAIELINAVMTGGGVMCVMMLPKIQLVWKLPNQLPVVVQQNGINQNQGHVDADQHHGHYVSNPAHSASSVDHQLTNISHSSNPALSPFPRATNKSRATKSTRPYN